MIIYQMRDDENKTLRAEKVTKSISTVLSKLVNGYNRQVEVDEGIHVVRFRDAFGHDTEAREGDYICSKDMRKFFAMDGTQFELTYREKDEDAPDDSDILPE